MSFFLVYLNFFPFLYKKEKHVHFIFFRRCLSSEPIKSGFNKTHTSWSLKDGYIIV